MGPFFCRCVALLLRWIWIQTLCLIHSITSSQKHKRQEEVYLLSCQVEQVHYSLLYDSYLPQQLSSQVPFSVPDVFTQILTPDVCLAQIKRTDELVSDEARYCGTHCIIWCLTITYFICYLFSVKLILKKTHILIHIEGGWRSRWMDKWSKIESERGDNATRKDR